MFGKKRTYIYLSKQIFQVFCGLILIICCCCVRCFGTGCTCCNRICRTHNTSNDPLVNGEFKETLDSKDIGYLKKETDRKIVTV